MNHLIPSGLSQPLGLLCTAAVKSQNFGAQCQQDVSSITLSPCSTRFPRVGISLPAVNPSCRQRCFKRPGWARKSWPGATQRGTSAWPRRPVRIWAPKLGPAAGGLVRDSRLVCPFHGFQFDVSGQCVATPFAAAPRATKLKVFETREVLGMVFAWWGRNGRPPQWRLPEGPPAGNEWSELNFRTIRFPGHPQETSENAVDLAHLRYMHGYGNVSRVGPLSVEGACLKSCFDFKRTNLYRRDQGLPFRRLRRHLRLWTGVFPSRHSRTFHWHGFASLGAGNSHRRQAHRPRAGRAGAGDSQTEAADHGFEVPSTEAAHQDHEQNHDVCAGTGRSAGCGDLGTETIPLPPTIVSVRRRDRGFSTLLPTVLSG